VATRRGRPTQAEAKRLDQTIREAAVATFAEFGYAETSMEAIARAAGVTRRSLYARYPDKRAVFVDVIPWAMTKFDDGKSIEAIIGDDLEATLLIIARACLARAVRPETLRLKRMALNEAVRGGHRLSRRDGHQRLPQDASRLLHMLYSMVLVSYAVNVFKQNRIPDSGAAFFEMVAEPSV
jgi:AcrR family transcriptional regulator